MPSAAYDLRTTLFQLHRDAIRTARKSVTPSVAWRATASRGVRKRHVRRHAGRDASIREPSAQWYWPVAKMYASFCSSVNVSRRVSACCHHDSLRHWLSGAEWTIRWIPLPA